MKNLTETNIKGVYEVEFFNMKDERGSFVKPFHRPTLEQHGLVGDFAESFYSINSAGVIRGMHFQYPPDDHAKLVYCTSGRLIDVILDIRKDSPTYGQFTTVELSGENSKGVYLPTGTAHGFCTLEDNTCMVYLTSTVHSPDNDGGILYNSFGMNWPINNAIHSERDLQFPTFENFETPF